MIDAKEMRLNNLVRFTCDGDIDKVDGIGKDYVTLENYGGEWSVEIEPIPLSSELLIKCGFEETGCMNADYIPIEWENDEFGYVYKDKDGVFYYELSRDDFGNMTDGVEIKHLHQLQNLYFALTQKELEVNL